MLPGQVDIRQAACRLRRLILIIKIQHCVKTVAIVVALHHAVAPGLAGHPERRIIQRFIRTGFFPFRQRFSGLGF